MLPIFLKIITFRRTSFYSGYLSSTWIIVIGVGCFVALVAGIIFCFCMSHNQQTKRRRVASVGEYHQYV